MKNKELVKKEIALIEEALSIPSRSTDAYEEDQILEYCVNKLKEFIELKKKDTDKWKKKLEADIAEGERWSEEYLESGNDDVFDDAFDWIFDGYRIEGYKRALSYLFYDKVNCCA